MRLFFVLLVPVLRLAGQGFPASYTISTAAGSDWVGDQGQATSAILRQAEGLTSDTSGNLYVADAVGHRIRVVSPAGVIRTLAGTGVRGFSGDGGPAIGAQLDSPYGILLDPRGNLLVADLGNSRVRRIAPDGTITTIAGGGKMPAGGLNEGSSATVLALNAPRNLAMDSAGSLYISDFAAHRVYRLDRGGSLTTAAGTGVPGFGGDGGASYSAQLAYPAALAVDQQDNLYIADTQNHLIRKVARGLITSYARAATPTGLAIDGHGTLYIADASGGQIVEVPVSGKSSALPLSAQDLAFATDGNLYVSNGTLVRRVSPNGAVTLAAGGGDTAHGDQADAKLALLNHPAGCAMDAAGNLYIADRDNNRIRRVSPAGIITTVAGTGTSGDTGDGLPATSATLNAPSAVSVDATGVVYITDTGNHRIRKIALDGTMFAVLGTGLQAPVYTLPGPAGDLFIADTGAILHWSGGILTTLKTGLQGPRGLALDAQGNLYFTEMDAARVSRMAPDGTVSQLAAGFWNIPRGVAVTSAGAVLVADTGPATNSAGGFLGPCVGGRWHGFGGIFGRWRRRFSRTARFSVGHRGRGWRRDVLRGPGQQSHPRANARAGGDPDASLLIRHRECGQPAARPDCSRHAGGDPRHWPGCRSTSRDSGPLRRCGRHDSIGKRHPAFGPGPPATGDRRSGYRRPVFRQFARRGPVGCCGGCRACPLCRFLWSGRGDQRRRDAKFAIEPGRARVHHLSLRNRARRKRATRDRSDQWIPKRRSLRGSSGGGARALSSERAGAGGICNPRCRKRHRQRWSGEQSRWSHGRDQVRLIAMPRSLPPTRPRCSSM